MPQTRGSPALRPASAPGLLRAPWRRPFLPAVPQTSRARREAAAACSSSRVLRLRPRDAAGAAALGCSPATPSPGLVGFPRRDSWQHAWKLHAREAEGRILAV